MVVSRRTGSNESEGPSYLSDAGVVDACVFRAFADDASVTLELDGACRIGTRVSTIPSFNSSMRRFQVCCPHI